MTDTAARAALLAARYPDDDDAQRLADRACTLRTATGVLKALIYTTTKVDIELPADATMH